jgi:type I restriction enzyme, S subunit
VESGESKVKNSQPSTLNVPLIPPGYKQTEVGVIPEDWEVVTAFEACSKIQDGTHFSPRSGGNDYLYVTSRNVRFGHLDLSTAGWIDATQHQAIYRRCDVKKGDLLLTKDGASTGNAALNTLVEQFSLLSSVAFLRFNPNKHCAAYFLQQVLAPQGQRQIQDAMAGNAITRLTLEKINKLRFPLPPTPPEQEAIAEALSDADALIESLEQLLTKKRQLKQGAMQELLTGKKRLPGFSGEWEVKRLGEILSRLANGAVYKATNSLGLSITRIETIADGTIDYSRTGRAEVSVELESYKLVSGDILFSHINSLDHIGKVAQFLGEQDLYHGMNLLLIRVNEYAHSRFLYFWFTSTLARQKARNLARQAVSQASINTTELKALEILLPALPEQAAIATILSDMDAEIAALEAKLAKARQLKQGMMQELLTGRIRLV